MRVIGVAKTGKYRALNEPSSLHVYTAETQFGRRSLATVIRTAGDPTVISREVERVALAIDPALKPIAALSMTDYTAAAFFVPRIAAILLTVLGAAALLLAALGIYGVMSYSVGQRTREIGIRMALGARGADVVGQFVRQGMMMAGIGLMAGVLGAWVAAQLLSSLLVGMSTSDPAIYALVISGLVLVALLACWLPARRAAQVDPLEALRCE
jgi:putative ABC transport system permease protein